MLRPAAAILTLLLALPLGAQLCGEREVPDDAWVPTQITLDDARGFTPRRILVMHAFWDNGPEALLVDDPNEVAAMFDLLAGNERVGHLCGYHWALVFEDDSRHIREHLHNNGCETYRRDAEEIAARLQRYFDRVRTKATHYRIEVELDPSADPEATARLFERDGRHAMFLASPDWRLPRLRITKAAYGPMPKDDASAADYEALYHALEAAARARLDDVIAHLIAGENARVIQPPAEVAKALEGTRSSFTMQAVVGFPLGFQQSRLDRYKSELALPADAGDTLRILASAESAFEPAAPYTMTLVSPQPYSTKLGDAIKAMSPLVKKVAPPQQPGM